MQRDQVIQQHRNIDTIYRSSVVNVQAITGIEKYPDVGNNCLYAIDSYSQAYGETIFCFRHLGKCDILRM